MYYLLIICLNFLLSFFIFNMLFAFMRIIVIKYMLEGLDKKELFDYLIEDRVFIKSLFDEDIKHYKKVFDLYYRNRLKH